MVLPPRTPGRGGGLRSSAFSIVRGGPIFLVDIERGSPLATTTPSRWTSFGSNDRSMTEGEVLVDRADRGRSLPDGRLRPASSSRTEHRRAAKSPGWLVSNDSGNRSSSAHRPSRWSGPSERSVRTKPLRSRAAQPDSHYRCRFGADEREQGGARQHCLVAGAVRRWSRSRPSAVTGVATCPSAIDEIARHALAQIGASDHDSDGGAGFGQEHRRLPG